MKRLKEIFIKVLSLGVGLAVGMVLIANVCFELSYDKAFADVEQIYSIRTGHVQPGGEDTYNNISGAVAHGFKQEVPGVVEATRITSLFDNPRWMDDEGNVVEATMILADSCFFRIFDSPALAGDPAKALAVPRSAVVTRPLAEKLGGVGECIGKILCNEDMPALKVTVEAVVEAFPENCSFGDMDMFVSLETYSRRSTENWLGNDRYQGWVKLDRGVDPNSLSEAIRRMQEAHQPLAELEQNGTRLWYFLTPFDRLHTSDRVVRSNIVMMSTVAFLLVLISLLNYILIVISSMVKRSREVGVRKCYGATSGNIYGMLSREALLHIVLSFALAAAIIMAGRGLIRNLLDVELADLIIPQSVAAVGLLVAAILAVSIVVPAQLYMRVPVYAALKNYTDTSRRWKLGLLGVQVFINVFLVVVMLVAGSEYRLLMNDDPGYDMENLLHLRVVYADDWSVDRVVDALNEQPEVAGVATCADLPFGGISGDNILDEDMHELFNVADNYEVSTGFYDLLGIGFVDGREPQNDSECAVDENFAVKINEFFDWSDGVVGKTIRITGHSRPEYTITGVYRNILTGNSLARDERPGVRFWSETGAEGVYMPNVLVKVTHIDSELLQRIGDIVTEACNGVPADVNVYADSYRSLYGSVLKIRNTLLVGSLFSLFIALMGLIGFIRDETLRRSKEIAIRKINGATVADILTMFARSVLRLSAVMALLACVAAYAASGALLEQFAMKVQLSPLWFILGSAAVLAAVVAVVTVNCYRIAVSNPVDSLKNE